RRHTRFSRDWSSDVCSSDLRPRVAAAATPGELAENVEQLRAREVALERGDVLVDHQVELDRHLVALRTQHAARDRNLCAGEVRDAGNPGTDGGRIVREVHGDVRARDV